MAGESRGCSTATPVDSRRRHAAHCGNTVPRVSTAPRNSPAAARRVKANGVIQAILVRPLPSSAADAPRYEIVTGERRWQAAKLAGLTDVPVMIRELSDKQAIAVALIEHIQREELTPAEEARALQLLTREFSLTHERLAEVVGRSRAAVQSHSAFGSARGHVGAHRFQKNQHGSCSGAVGA